MQTIFAIAAGGAIGAVLRHFISLWAALPVFGGILTVNILGSFMLGALVSWFAHVQQPPQAVTAFLTVGLLGAFTTFSTFSMEAIGWLQKGEVFKAIIYITLSVTLALAGFWLGLEAVKKIIL